MKELFKSNIDSIVPYEPGRPIEEIQRELGLNRVIKLASNENPLGPSPKAVRAMRQAIREMHLYPDGAAYYLKERLTKEFSLTPKQLVIGNGSNEIIELLARGFLVDGDQVISSEKTFLVYPLISQVCGATFVTVPMKGYSYDLAGIGKKINGRTKLIFIANPNNPTGTYVSFREVENFLAKVPERVLICFDEAYIDFADAKDFPNALNYIKAGMKNVISLRTFSKAQGLAGLRIGYGIVSEEISAYLDKVRQPFNVNRMAQIAACSALDDKTFRLKTKRLVSRGKKYLYEQLDKLGLEYVPSQANFVLIDVKLDAKKVFQEMLKEGVIVRAMTAYDLASHIRVTIGMREELEEFLRVLELVLKRLGKR